jgi:hypothetical protein
MSGYNKLAVFAGILVGGDAGAASLVQVNQAAKSIARDRVASIADTDYIHLSIAQCKGSRKAASGKERRRCVFDSSDRLSRKRPHMYSTLQEKLTCVFYIRRIAIKREETKWNFSD